MAAVLSAFTPRTAPPVLNPAFLCGTASRLPDITRPHDVYLTVGTPGTGLGVAIGPDPDPRHTVYAAAEVQAGQLITIRLPAGWWLRWGSPDVTLAGQLAVGC
jgi:sugar (pentulose or hexulose) kinase